MRGESMTRKRFPVYVPINCLLKWHLNNIEYHYTDKFTQTWKFCYRLFTHILVQTQNYFFFSSVEYNRRNLDECSGHFFNTIMTVTWIWTWKMVRWLAAKKHGKESICALPSKLSFIQDTFIYVKESYFLQRLI